jgi:hypothetical protein
VTTTEKPRRPAKPAPAPEPEAPVRPRLRTTVTLGPFLVALTEDDLRAGRATVLVAMAYLAPDDPADGDRTAVAVQGRLSQVLRDGIPVESLQQVAGTLFDRVADPEAATREDEPVRHGVRIAQLSVGLLPRAETERMQPVATVTVSDLELVPAGNG